MNKLYLVILALSLTACATFNVKLIGWYTNQPFVETANHQFVEIVGNPRITCYTKYGYPLADGYFVKVEGEYLVVDEFGKDYVYIQDNDLGNYCMLWEKN